jgi:hydrophobe/amphiphile efflux-3 (HAE3) family protein
MQRFWSWLAVYLGKHAGVVTLVGLIVTLSLGFGITRLEFATGQDSYLNRDDQIYTDNVAYQDLFGGQAMLSVIAMDEGATIDEIFTPEGIAALEETAARIRQVDGVQGVISPLTALEFSSTLVQPPEGGTVFDAIGSRALLRAQEVALAAGDTASAEARAEDLTRTSERLLAIPPDQQVLSNPDYVDFLLYDNRGEVRKALRPFFPDATHAQMITRLDGNLSIEDEGAASEQVLAISEDLEFPNARVVNTGAPVLLKEINDYLRTGMLTLGGIALAVMALILIIFFDVRWRLLPLAVVTVGVIWAFGLIGYAGIPLTLVTIAGLPVMLGMGIDYAIQMHSRVEEEVIIDRTPHPIQETARQLGTPMLVVTANSVLAFLAILRSQTPMIRQFGLLLAVGIVAICISSIVNPLAVLGIREFKRPTRGKSWTDGPLARFVNALGSLPAGVAVVLVVASAAVFGFGAYYESSLEIQTDPIRWVNQRSEVVRDIRDVEKEIGGSSELGVYVINERGGTVFDDPTVEFVDRMTRETLEAYPERLLVGSSIVATVSDLTEVPGAAHVPPSAELVRAAWEVAPEDVRTSTASEDGTAMNAVFLTGKGSLEQRRPIVEQIRARDDEPPGVRATPSGLAVVGVGLLENLTKGRIQLTYLALGLVLVWLTVAFRSLVRSVLAMVPVLIAVGTASLVAYFGGFKLSPMTAVGGPLVVAACTEFTTLILYRYLEERRRGLEPRAAVDMAGARTGRAFVVSALTTMAGVAVIAQSSLPLLRDFGLTVAVNVTVALTAALVVLPPLLVWADRRGWVSRGMLERAEAPFLDVPTSEAQVAAPTAAGSGGD